MELISLLYSMKLAANKAFNPMFFCSDNVRFWPFLPVNEGFNVAESNFRFVPESGHSKYTFGGRSECLLMAESRRSLTLFNGDFGPGTGRSDDIFRG